ncbi:MAG TPA: hypothetical protein VNJ46_10080 [Gaiellaceae bacterium]|nr:hypothetical protein [Gaiellaceae bacterium]
METFVVRIWTPENRTGAEEPPRLHGVVERAGTRERWRFKDEEELLRILRTNAAAGAAPRSLRPGAATSPERAQ